ncbi:hypothetical protein AAFF_G00210710 [Aldrovandia affinis]|uniref:Uncharacterized protein n=1 Tax=Aldrovandia affinis TaxID=143900 RepID=A0AAD7SWL3_9TELE|nr:hypothetical protein AAFF_G00210710 [Aldrovandia affinis]
MGLTKPFSLEELNTSINTLKTENTFEAIEVNLTTTLDELLFYYERNHLHANPAKTQVCSFHLRNREANQPNGLEHHLSTVPILSTLE